MGRKNRDLSYLKPFCFYCDKTFKNEVYLHQHQKAKHFTCQRCQKKFSSCDSLKNHAESAHHETLTKIPNALQDRNDIKNKIFGMQGVPRIEIEKRIRRGAEEYWTKVLQAQFARSKKELKARQKQFKESQQTKAFNEKKNNQQIDDEYKIRRGDIPSRGVNLGGWLVVEHWMTSDSIIWQGVPNSISDGGEYQTMKFWGHSEGDWRFEQHRATWIVESDIAEIAKYGLNTVRVPVGFWIGGFDNFDPSGQGEWKQYAPGALRYLDTLIKVWAKKYNIAVMLSYHAAKGSQNGNDHSSPSNPGHTYWGEYEENILNTIDVCQFLSARYQNEEAFLGIGLLNEPSGTTTNEVLIDYYTRAYNIIRAQNSNSISLTHAPLLWEQGPPYWQDFTKPPQYYNCLHEWHKYLVWGYEGWSESRLIGEGLDGVANEINQWKGNYLFIGEWSVASNAPFNDLYQYRTFTKKYIETMNKVHGGWTFWTWKKSGDTIGRDSWSLRNQLRNGDILQSWYQV